MLVSMREKTCAVLGRKSPSEGRREARTTLEVIAALVEREAGNLTSTPEP